MLYALLNASLDKVDQATDTFRSSDPIERVLEVAGIAADVYARDPAFYQPLMQFLLGVREVAHRPRFIARSLALWNRTVQAAIRHGSARRDVAVDPLARQLMINFAGVLELWIHEELDEDGLRDQALYGSTLLLLGASLPSARARLVERLDSDRSQASEGTGRLTEAHDSAESTTSHHRRRHVMHVGTAVIFQGAARAAPTATSTATSSGSATSPSRSASSRCGASSTTSPTTRCAPTCCST